MKFYPLFHYCPVLLILHIFLASVNSTKLPPNCGKLETIPGDIRTFAPWTAAIFVRQPEDDLTFLTTGVIIGPNSVLATARGPLGAVLRGTNDDGLLPPGHVFVVGAGLNSTDYYAAHAHAQFSEVNHLEPSMYHEDANEQYHYIIYHLKNEFNLTTPYVKSICLLEDIKNNVIPPFELEAISSGFTVRNVKDQVAELRISSIETLTEGACSSYFRFHYKRELNESQVICGAKKNGGNKTISKYVDYLKNITTDLENNSVEDFCFLHGSIGVFDINDQWFLAGVVALIPGRKKGLCNDQTTYMYGRIGAHVKWMVNSIKCSPGFACEDPAKKCIHITSVCNGVQNCPGGKDEQERFCKSQDQCNIYTKKPMHSCGITGKCILQSQLCNGKADCADGSDEQIHLCANGTENALEFSLRSLNKNCPKLVLPKGVQAKCPDTESTCLNVTVPKTTVILSCQEFYSSPFEYSSVVITCDGKKGTWKKSLPFSCSSMCGILSSSAKSEKLVFTIEENLPWNGFIVPRLGLLPGSQCSAVSIDSSFVLTSRRCIEGFIDAPQNLSYVKQQSAANENWSLNHISKFRKPNKIWTRAAQLKDKGGSDELALVQLEPLPQKDLQDTPVCFLSNSYSMQKKQPLNSTAILVHMSSKANSTGGKVEVPQPVYYKLAPRVECESKFGVLNVPEYVFCAKILKGSALRPFDQGAGLYTRQKSSISGDFQFQLQGIAVQPQLPLSSNITAKYQLFVSTDYFLDWVTEIMEQNY